MSLTSTGEADYNELYPNDNVQPGIEKTCLDLYREFHKDSDPFLLQIAEK